MELNSKSIIANLPLQEEIKTKENVDKQNLQTIANFIKGEDADYIYTDFDSDPAQLTLKKADKMFKEAEQEHFKLHGFSEE